MIGDSVLNNRRNLSIDGGHAEISSAPESKRIKLPPIHFDNEFLNRLINNNNSSDSSFSFKRSKRKKSLFRRIIDAILCRT